MVNSFSHQRAQAASDTDLTEFRFRISRASIRVTPERTKPVLSSPVLRIDSTGNCAPVGRVDRDLQFVGKLIVATDIINDRSNWNWAPFSAGRWSHGSSAASCFCLAPIGMNLTVIMLSKEV